MNTNQRSLLYDLAGDISLRQEFCSSPSSVLARYGYDASRLQIPTSLDPKTLETRLKQILAGDVSVPAKTVSAMTPDELWSSLLFMKETHQTAGSDIVLSPTAATVLIYGTVALPGIVGGTGLENTEDWAKLKHLETLSPSSLSITIKGKDGIVAENLAPHIAAAFLKRVLKPYVG